MANDFSINIKIGLENEGKNLLNQWNTLKTQIQNDKLSINFGDTLTSSIKSITQISTQISNLSKQVDSLNNIGKNIELINTDNLKYSIKGAVTSLNEVKKVIKDLGIKNVVSIDINGIDKNTQEITKFIVKVKEAEGILNNFQFTANRQDKSRTGTMLVTGYEGSLSKIKDSIEQEAKNREKIQQAISSTIQKREEESRLLQQNQANAINKTLEQEAKDRDLINRKISETIAKREEESRRESELQAKYSNKALDETYNQQQKSENKKSQLISSFGTNLGNNSSLNLDSNISEVEKYLKTISNGNIQLNQFGEIIEQNGVKFRQFHYMVDEGNNRFSRYTGTITDLNNNFHLLGKGIVDTTSKHKSFTDVLKSAMESVMGFSLVSGAFFSTISAMKEMLVYTGQMDNALSNLNKVANMTKSQLESMKNSALDLGEALGRGSVDIMDAMSSAGREYKDEESIKTMAKVATISSNVTDMSAKDSAKAINNTMKAFHQDINSAMDDLNSFNEIQNNFNTTTTDLAQSISKIGSTASDTAKLTFHELNGISTALISATGIQGDEAGNSIKSIISKTYALGRNGEDGKGQRFLKSIADVDVREASGEYKSFQKILEEVHNKWNDLTNAQRLNLAQAVGGTEHYNQFQVIMENWDTAIKATKTSIDSQDSALIENQKYLASTEGKMNQLKVASERLANDFISSDTTKGFIDFTKGVVNGADSIIKTFGSIPSVVALASSALLGFNKNLQIFTNLNGKIGVNSSITNSLENYTNAYSKNLQAIQSTNNTLMQAPTLLERTSATMKTLTASTIGQTVATTALNVAIGMGIGLAIGVIIEKITKWINKNQELNQSINESITSMNMTQDNINNIDNLIKKYDELNNITNRSKEQNDELINIQKQLAQVLPESTTKYDEQNQALATNIDRVRELNKEQKEGLKTKAIATINLIDPNDLQKQLSDAKQNKKELEDVLSNPNTDKKWYKAEGDLLPSYGKEAKEKMAKELNNEQKNVEELNKKVQSYNQAVAILNSLGDTQYQKINIVSNATKNNTNETIKNTEVKKANAEAIEGMLQSEEDLQKSLSGNLDKITEYGKMLNEIQDKGTLSTSSRKSIIDHNPELIPYLSDMGKLTEELTNRISNLKQASEGTFAVIQIQEEQKSIQDLVSTYDELSGRTDLSVEQQATLSNVIEQLQGKLDGLIVTKHEDGKVTIDNLSIAKDKIKSLDTESQYLQLLAQVGKDKARAMIIAEVEESNNLRKQTEARLADMKSEFMVRKAIANQKFAEATTPEEIAKAKEIARINNELFATIVSEQQKLDDTPVRSATDAIKAMDEADSKASNSKKTLSDITSNLTEDTNKNTKAVKENKEQQEALADAIKKVKNEMKVK